MDCPTCGYDGRIRSGVPALCARAREESRHTAAPVPAAPQPHPEPAHAEFPAAHDAWHPHLSPLQQPVVHGDNDFLGVHPGLMHRLRPHVACYRVRVIAMYIPHVNILY